MSHELRVAGRAVLNIFRERVNADLITAHIFNAHSDWMWLFHRGAVGGFVFEEIMHGPLTLQEQFDRVTCKHEGEPITFKISQKDFPGIRIRAKILENKATTFDNRIMGGSSFAEREKIAGGFNIEIYKEVDESGKKKKKVTKNDKEKKKSCKMYINVCYRDKGKGNNPTRKDLIDHVNAFLSNDHLKLIRELLVPLLDKPRLGADLAWIYRSKLLYFWKQLSEQLPKENTDIKEEVNKLYQELVNCANELIRPRPSGSKASQVCSLELLHGNNKLELVASTLDPKPTKAQLEKWSESKGIIYYVAHSGHTFLVNDIPAYKEDWEEYKTNIGNAAVLAKCNHKMSKPEYINYGNRINGKSELAVGLIVQGKVVGVLNFEASEINAYDDESVLLAAQLGSFTAYAIRQAKFSAELRMLFQFINDLRGLDDKEKIYKKAIESVMESFQVKDCFVWEFEKNKDGGLLYKINGLQNQPEQDKLRHNPGDGGEGQDRKPGFGQWIRDKKLPIAIVNLRRRHKDDVARLARDAGFRRKFTDEFGCYTGCYSKGSSPLNNDFSHWTLVNRKANEEIPLSANKILQDLIPTPEELPPEDLLSPAVTNIGFPIFNSDGEVRAVLFITYLQHFTTLPSDEAWGITSLCNHIGYCLSLLSREADVDLTDVPVKKLLEKIQWLGEKPELGGLSLNNITKKIMTDTSFTLPNGKAPGRRKVEGWVEKLVSAGHLKLLDGIYSINDDAK